MKRIILIGNENSIGMDVRLAAKELDFIISDPIYSIDEIKQLCGEIEFDIFIVDMQISDSQNCLSIIPEIRNISDLPIIFVYSGTEKEGVIKNKIFDSYSLIRKPITVNILEIAIESAFYKYEMKNALQQSADTINALLGVRSGHAMLVGEKGKILGINDQFCKLLKTEPHKMINRLSRDVVPPELFSSRNKQILKVLESRKELIFVDSYLSRVYENHVFPIKDNFGKVFRLALFSRDITKDEKAKETVLKLSKAVETMQLGVTILDMDLKIIYCNEAEAKMHGFLREELIGKKPYIFLPKNNNIDIVDDLHKNIRGISQERINLKKDGSQFPVRIISDLVIDDLGKPFAIVTTCEDISIEKELASQLLRSERLAGVGSLAAGIAHEIRNPLGNISSSAQFCLSNKKITTEVEMFLKIIKRNADNANDIIKKLLDFANPREIKKYSVNVNRIILNALKMVKDRYSTHNIKLDVNLVEELPLLELDERWVEQSFINIIINGLESIEEEGEIKIESYQEQNNIVVVFKDTGCGMDSDVLGKIFDPFFTTKAENVGLGLSSINYILSEHNGSLKIKSDIGLGSKFTVLLPIC